MTWPQILREPSRPAGLVQWREPLNGECKARSEPDTVFSPATQSKVCTAPTASRHHCRFTAIRYPTAAPARPSEPGRARKETRGRVVSTSPNILGLSRKKPPIIVVTAGTGVIFSARRRRSAAFWRARLARCKQGPAFRLNLCSACPPLEGLPAYGGAAFRGGWPTLEAARRFWVAGCRTL